MTGANDHLDRSWGQEREAETRTYRARALDAERELEEAREEIKRLLTAAVCVVTHSHASTCLVFASTGDRTCTCGLDALRAALGTKP